MDRLTAPRTRPNSVGRFDSEQMTYSLLVIFTFWVLTLFEPDWFLSGTIGGPFYRIPTILTPILMIIILRCVTRKSIYWPLILFVLMHVGASLFAENRGLPREGLKFLVPMLLLFVGSVLLIDSPSKAVTVLKMFLLSFIWYGVQGIPGGRVSWHFLLANQDSYGPLMGMGLGYSYYFAMGMRSLWWRRLGYATFAICVVGIGASFARGAVLSAGLVLFVIWLRSPRKLATLMGVIVAAALFFLAIHFLFPPGMFFDEMKTISEGTKTGTGRARWILWQMAWEVFLESPLFGVGAGNFGVIASQIIPDDPTRPAFSESAWLWNKALHNIYVQVLSEEGIIGVLVWTAMVVGFTRRSKFLRFQSAVDQWNRRGGEGIDIRLISLGLECMMIAYLANGIFYNQLYIHWFWTLITITFVLSQVTGSSLVTANAGASRRGAGNEIKEMSRLAWNGPVRH